MIDTIKFKQNYAILNIIIKIIRIMLVTKGISKIRKFYYAFINRLVLYLKMRWSITILIVLAYF